MPDSGIEYLRFSRDAWGQETLQGVSWDLLGVLFGVAIAFVLIHALYARFAAPRRK